MTYSPEQSAQIKATICERISNGESLRSICADADMPAKATVLLWLNEDEAFSSQYVRAREEQADHYADEIIAIADTEEDPAKARVRVEARKWVASKLKPKKYGDRIQTDVSGSVTLEGLFAEVAAKGKRLVEPGE